MIIDDGKISAALEYLSDYPHPAALARHRLRMAEISRDKLYAKLFLEATGNIKERECAAQVDPLYIAACEMAADSEEAVEQQRARMKAAEMVIEIWRTESANARNAERVR